MMAHTPEISVIIPCYNQGRYLPDALDSLLAQTVADWECIVVNDGSTDETSKVTAHYSLMTSRIRGIHQKHAGSSAARNHGLQEASGAYIQFLDADDVMVTTKFEKQLTALSPHPELAVGLCDYSYTDPDGHIYLHHDCYRSPHLNSEHPQLDLALRWETDLSLPIHCFLFDARLFRNHGLEFDQSLTSNEDWDCWMRLFALHPTVVYVDEKLVLYRLHSDSKTHDRAEMRHSFLQAVDKQITLLRDDPELRSILTAKRKTIRRLYRDCVLPWSALKSLRSAAKALATSEIEVPDLPQDALPDGVQDV